MNVVAQRAMQSMDYFLGTDHGQKCAQKEFSRSTQSFPAPCHATVYNALEEKMTRSSTPFGEMRIDAQLSPAALITFEV
jgi:hypothetical protein